jgi:hypothetical protein
MPLGKQQGLDRWAHCSVGRIMLAALWAPCQQSFWAELQTVFAGYLRAPQHALRMPLQALRLRTALRAVSPAASAALLSWGGDAFGQLGASRRTVFDYAAASKDGPPAFVFDIDGSYLFLVLKAPWWPRQRLMRPWAPVVQVFLFVVSKSCRQPSSESYPWAPSACSYTLASSSALACAPTSRRGSHTGCQGLLLPQGVEQAVHARSTGGAVPSSIPHQWRGCERGEEGGATVRVAGCARQAVAGCWLMLGQFCTGTVCNKRMQYSVWCSVVGTGVLERPRHRGPAL